MSWPAAPASPTSALRYYEELGLLPAPARIAGQRRYPESAAWLVGVILLLRDVGFSLSEQKAFMASRQGAPGDWQRLARRKLAELDDQIAKAQAAREAIDHALRCPYEDIRQCPTFAAVTTAWPASRSTKPTRISHCTPRPACGNVPAFDFNIREGRDCGSGLPAWVPETGSISSNREQRAGRRRRAAAGIPVITPAQLPAPPTSPCRCEIWS